MKVKSISDVKVGMYLIVTTPMFPGNKSEDWICQGVVKKIHNNNLIIEYDAFIVDTIDIKRGIVEAFTIEENPEMFL